MDWIDPQNKEIYLSRMTMNNKAQILHNNIYVIKLLFLYFWFLNR
jgi:hypothetical protein